jgi:hypothetical protein
LDPIFFRHLNLLFSLFSCGDSHDMVLMSGAGREPGAARLQL